LHWGPTPSACQPSLTFGPLIRCDFPLSERFRYARGDFKCGKAALLGTTIYVSASVCEQPAARGALYSLKGTKIANVGGKDFGTFGEAFVQLDDTTWAYLCDDKQLAEARARGDDTSRLQERYARTINTALQARPADMTITMHVCRGNFRSTWISSGGYEPVAETLLSKLNIDGYFLEYDTERAGGFEPLRFLPKGKKSVVLGLITSKNGTLEKKDDIKRRIDEASKYVELDQLCLSPQCGFASTEEGNILTEDAQWAKLAEIVEISHEVWD